MKISAPSEDRTCKVEPLIDGNIFFPPIMWEDKNLTIDAMVSPGLLMGALDWKEARYKVTNRYL